MGGHQSFHAFMVGFEDSETVLAVKHSIESIGQYPDEGENKSMAQVLAEMPEPCRLQPLTKLPEPQSPGSMLHVPSNAVEWAHMECRFFLGNQVDLKAAVCTLSEDPRCKETLSLMMTAANTTPNDRRIIICADSLSPRAADTCSVALNSDMIRVGSSGDEIITVELHTGGDAAAGANCHRLQVSADADVHSTISEVLGLRLGWRVRIQLGEDDIGTEESFREAGVEDGGRLGIQSACFSVHQHEWMANTLGASLDSLHNEEIGWVRDWKVLVIATKTDQPGALTMPEIEALYAPLQHHPAVLELRYDSLGLYDKPDAIFRDCIRGGGDHHPTNLSWMATKTEEGNRGEENLDSDD